NRHFPSGHSTSRVNEVTIPGVAEPRPQRAERVQAEEVDPINAILPGIGVGGGPIDLHAYDPTAGELIIGADPSTTEPPVELGRPKIEWGCDVNVAEGVSRMHADVDAGPGPRALTAILDASPIHAIRIRAGGSKRKTRTRCQSHQNCTQ